MKRAKEPSEETRLAAREKPVDSPVMYQSWKELTFHHWEISPQVIVDRLPEGLHVDLFEGRCFIGLVPFLMRKIRPRFLPAVPWLSNFLELNVRTYVYDDSGRPGVWFFSLDCNQPIAVSVARNFFHLPYEHARMSWDGKNYLCQRKGRPEESKYIYPDAVGDSECKISEPGSLEFFLLERYFLFSSDKKGQLNSGQVHHEPYPFCKMQTDKVDMGPLEWNGFGLTGDPISSLYSPGVDVNIFSLRKLERKSEQEKER